MISFRGFLACARVRGVLASLLLASCSTELSGEKDAPPTPAPLSGQPEAGQHSSPAGSAEIHGQDDASQPSYTEEISDRSAQLKEAKRAKDEHSNQNSDSPQSHYEQVGEASWYGGPKFHEKETASGETFNQNKLSAAHPTLPLGTKAKVTNLETGKSVEVEINDRGPSADGRAIDLSKSAARKIGIKKKDGTAKVKIEASSQ